RVTVRIPARERCEEETAFRRRLLIYQREILASLQDGPGVPTLLQDRQLADRTQDLANRMWLPTCAQMRGSGVEIPFKLVAVAPVGAPAPDAPPRSAYIVAPGTSVGVVARELQGDSSDTVMRCGFGRLVPAGESPSEGGLNELQVRVAIVG